MLIGPLVGGLVAFLVLLLSNLLGGLALSAFNVDLPTLLAMLFPS